MNPLVTNTRVLQWFCVYPLDESANKLKKCACVAFSLYILTSALAGVISSAAFIWKFMAIDLVGSVYALLQVAAYSSMTYIIVITFMMRFEITATIKQLSEIYDKFKGEDLARANNKCEWMWQIFFKFLMGGYFVETPILSILSILVCYMTNGSFNVGDVYHPLIFILPWNQSTLIGYVAEIAYGLNVSEAFLITNATILLLFISICLHHQAFYIMFRHSVSRLDRIDRDQNKSEVLCDLIRLHITAKNWFSETAKVYSPFIVVQLICGIIISACSVFQLDLVLRHIDFTIYVLLVSFACGLLPLFLYCFFGKSAASSFQGMTDCLYDANWHELPIKLQKYFIIMIANIQIPLYYHGFGMTILNLETFLKVTRAVVTYYMMFKTLASDKKLSQN